MLVTVKVIVSPAVTVGSAGEKRKVTSTVTATVRFAWFGSAGSPNQKSVSWAASTMVMALVVGWPHAARTTTSAAASEPMRMILG